MYWHEDPRSKYIHVQEGKNIQRTPWRNTIIEKTIRHLIPSSNSWWIKNIGLREIKLMVDTSLRLREEIYQLELWRHILKSDDTILNLWSCIVSININMLSKLILYVTDRGFNRVGWHSAAKAIAECSKWSKTWTSPARRSHSGTAPSRQDITSVTW
jgi:hypothetical protein